MSVIQSRLLSEYCLPNSFPSSDTVMDEPSGAFQICLRWLSGPAKEVFTSMHETAVAVQDHVEARGG